MTATAAVLVLALAVAAPAAAERSTVEGRVLEAYADVYRGYGLTVPAFRVEYVTDAKAAELVPEGFWAAALPDVIYLTAGAGRELRAFARAWGRRTTKARLLTYRSCGGECVGAVHTAGHEVAHLIQFHYGAALSEGVADAVAFDLHNVFLARALGGFPRGPGWEPTLAYREEAYNARAASSTAAGAPWRTRAARVARLTALSTPLEAA